MEIKVNEKIAKKFDKFMSAMVEEGIYPVGAEGQAVYEAVFNELFSDWKEQYEEQMDWDMPAWRDTENEVPEQIVVVRED